MFKPKAQAGFATNGFVGMNQKKKANPIGKKKKKSKPKRNPKADKQLVQDIFK